jgi:hypothetical protein
MRYRPCLEVLEERLPLGDAVLGPLAALALVSTRAVAPAAAPASSTASQAGAPAAVGRAGDFSSRAVTRPASSVAWLAPFGEDETAPGLAWDALTPPGPGTVRRRRAAFAASPAPASTPEASPELVSPAPADRAEPPAQAVPAPFAAGVMPADPRLRIAAFLPHTAPAATAVTPARQAQVNGNFGQLPLSFEENIGQADAQVHFLAHGPGYGLYLTGTEAVMVLSPPTAPTATPAGAVAPAGDPAALLRPDLNPPPQSETPPAVVRLQLAGANPAPAVSGLDRQPGQVNYFLGNDPAQWHTHIATFGRVQYDQVYPGIGLVYYGNQQQLEYDFVVAPGADPSAIRLKVSGAEHLEIDAAGDLLIRAAEPGSASSGFTLRQHKPFAYQEVNGVLREVASGFVVDPASGGRESPVVRFAVAAYDPAFPLVIDPVLSYSTYLGGSSADRGNGIAVDPTSGDVLLTGLTSSMNFPTANPLQADSGGGGDAFVARLSADGSALVYSTYLGGSDFDYGSGIAVDPASGDALVTGYTYSTNFPTANPLQASYGGGATDAFVARLSANGSALLFSTYLGGNGFDYGDGIAVDPGSGDVLVTGSTSSANFPTANLLQASHGGGFWDAFVARLSADGSALVYSTYLGGSGTDYGAGIAVDPATGDVLVTGLTGSTNFPTANPLQGTNAGGGDAFVARLSADGSALVYSTYLGGSGLDEGYAIAVDPASGDALVTGQTFSTDFPTANPLQGTNAGGGDAFVARLSADGSVLVYSTYLGGSGADSGSGIAVDPASGDALLTGWTASTNFPTANPLQTSFGGGHDAFVARVSADGSALVYSTYLGGSALDEGYGITMDPGSGDALVTGRTDSTNFPTANPLQATNAGGGDAFVARIS